MSSIQHSRHESTSASTPPFPWRQMSILALCRLCEPVAFMSVFPYIHSMMKSFGYEHEKDITLYASMVTSAFAFAEFSTGLFWGRISDRFGRKPVLLMGMFGTGLSMLLFGLSPSLPVALIARALGGLLNGNIGVIQTTVAEVVTIEKHRPRAYSIMPFVWSIGSIIGAWLGGTLSNPVIEYPRFFRPGSIWETYPYLLPNLVCVVFVFFGLGVGILFLEETHEQKKDKPDFGLRAGQWLLEKIPSSRNLSRSGRYERVLGEKADITDEHSPLLQPCRSNQTYDAPTVPTHEDESVAFASAGNVLVKSPKIISFREAFTPQIVLTVCATGILAFHTISLEQQLPLLMAAPLSSKAPQLPFKFQAGLNMSDREIGSILSVQGALQMFAQLILFPIVNRRLGSLWTFRLVIFAYPILYIMTPYLALLPKSYQTPGMYLILTWKVIGQSMSYPSAQMIVANLAKSKLILGTINGVASSSQSLCRGLGPLFSGSVQSAGTSLGYSGLTWWVCALISFIGAVESLFMKGYPKAKEFQDEESNLNEPEPIDGMQKIPAACGYFESDQETLGEGSESEDDGTLYDSPRSSSLDDISRPTSLDLHASKLFPDHD